MRRGRSEGRGLGVCKRRRASVATLLAAAGVGGCAPAPALDAPPVGAEAEAGSGSGAGSRPASGAAGAGRSGSLRQDQISVRMTAGDLLIEITPLAPQVLEAAAPDTKRRLERVAAAHRPDVGGNRPDFGGNRGDFGANGSEGPPALFLVAFSTDRPATTFEPGDLHLISRGLRQRPVFVEPITPGWGSRQLAQRSAALAVYGYPGTVDLSRELVVAYQGVEDSSWAGILAEIEAERARTTSENRSRIS